MSNRQEPINEGTQFTDETNTANATRDQNIDTRGGQQFSGQRLEPSGRRRVKHEIRYKPSSSLSGVWAGLIGVGAGMAAMYLLDPNRGGRRRALIADQVTSATSFLPDNLSGRAQDISNRARGAWAEVTKMFTSDRPSDQVLEARVRSKMGRVVSHPHAIHVAANNGHITLEGTVAQNELNALLNCVNKVRGVQSVDNRLQHAEEQGGEMQGQRRFAGETLGESHEGWSPARLGAGALGLGLSALGAALVARSFTSGESSGFFGMGNITGPITVEKSITVDAPADVLFEMWSNFENFPRFMSNVLEIRNTGERRSHWRVKGPAGVPVEWDAETTEIVPNEMIAWRSLEGSTVDNAGYVLFEPLDGNRTEVTVRLNYNPPAGPIGHAVAKVFGADPKSEMDQDLMRMKSMLETGRFPHDAAQTPVNPARARRVH
jgi:uncharacterized membrane protein